MNTREKIIALEKCLNRKYINRQEVVRGLLVTLLAKGNIVLLGPAGTGKTDMVETLAKCISGRVFETILTKTSSPEELFGPYSLKELEKGNYIRNTSDTLVDSDVGFVDEVFKCNSAVLNNLLGVLAQRTYKNGGNAPQEIPLQLLVGASNELPEDGVDGPLAALWDRFEMRFRVEYLKDRRSFAKLLAMNHMNLEPNVSITMDEIREAQESVKGVQTAPIEPLIGELWKQLSECGFKMSDRKWRNSVKYMQANAYIEGRDQLTSNDIKILQHIVWNDWKDEIEIKAVIFKVVAPNLSKLQDMFSASETIYNELMKFTADENDNRSKFGTTRSLKATEVHQKLTKTRADIKKSLEDEKANGRDTSEITKMDGNLEEMLKNVTEILIGNL